MNVVDSSAWVEYLADGPNADFFAKPIEDAARLLVPSVSLYEVFKKVLVERNEAAALQAAAVMQQGTVIALDGAIALAAAGLSVLHRLPMADAMMLATTRAHRATLWTQDADFEGIDGVEYRAKR